MITIGLLDDHPLIVSGIQRMLQNNSDIQLHWAISQPDDLQERLLEAPIDLLLLDINLTVANGLELCKKLHKQYPALYIIMLTSYVETTLVKAALRNGAMGYLLKNAADSEIVDAIQSVFRGERYLPQRIRDLLLEESLSQQPNQSPSPMPQLTRRELDVLRLIVQALTNQEIADKLFVSPKTIETHRMNLFQKMGVKNTAGLVRIAMEKGLV
ncbi:response regulator [Spirosoma flavum]|uniref:Response regulator n=1 Tax=Spirosoma flavum TaxID=2048557 RepID=A0ABW6AMH5_9BACT